MTYELTRRLAYSSHNGGASSSVPQPRHPPAALVGRDVILLDRCLDGRRLAAVFAASLAGANRLS